VRFYKLKLEVVIETAKDLAVFQKMQINNTGTSMHVGRNPNQPRAAERRASACPSAFLG
jgi:hypothetical protein